MNDNTLSATKWVKYDSLIVNRDGLNYGDPESWWQLWKKKYNEELPYEVALDIFPDLSFDYYNDIIEGKIDKAYIEEQAYNYAFYGD